MNASMTSLVNSAQSMKMKCVEESKSDELLLTFLMGGSDDACLNMVS